MRFLLDTNALSSLAARHPAFVARSRRYSTADFGISAIVAFEFQFGILRSARAEVNAANFRRLRLEVVPFDADDSAAAAAVRANLATLGSPIGPYDTLIAGQALARDLTLITHNTREFARVPRLKLEDWLAE